jgi:hypothetical protein
MSSFTISCIVFACILGGIFLGTILRAVLVEKQLSSESKDLIKMSMGLLGTLTALVLGLLIASAKNSFDAQRNGLAQLAGNVIFLDRVLARYGTETKDAREMLRASVADMLQRTWPAENPEPGHAESKSGTEGRYEELFAKLEALAPKEDSKRALQTLAIKTAMDIAQARWLLFAQKGSSISKPFLVVMVSWLVLILGSFSLLAPPNPTVFAALLICALAVSSAVFLILELDRPFEGMIEISSAPVRAALEQLGR